STERAITTLALPREAHRRIVGERGTALHLSGGPDDDCSNAYAWRPVDPRANGRDGHSSSYLPDYENVFTPRCRASENAILASTQTICLEVEAPVPSPAILRASSCVNRRNLLGRRPVDVEPGFTEGDSS